MTYSLNDFKTGRKVSTPAKKALWNLIIKRTFGGWDCATNTFESHQSTGTWLGYRINGMVGYLDELTGGDYGKSNPKLERVAGTLARQFKVKFKDIKFLMCGTSYVTIDQALSTPVVPQTKIKKDLDRSKVHSVLSYIYSQKLNENELQFISKELVI